MIRDRMKFTILGDSSEELKAKAIETASVYYGFPVDEAHDRAEFEMEVSVMAPDSQFKFYADVYVRPKLK